MRNPFTKKDRPVRLHQLLSTKDEAQQVAMVQALAQPTIIVTITLSPYDAYLTVGAQSDHGGQVAPELVYRMLDMARLRVQAIEREQTLSTKDTKDHEGGRPSSEVPPGSAETPAPTQETAHVAPPGRESVLEDVPNGESSPGGLPDVAVPALNGAH